MVLLEAGRLPRRHFLTSGSVTELRGITQVDRRGHHRRARDLHRSAARSVIQRGVPAGRRGGARDRRSRDPEPRHRRRQHRQRVARRLICRRRCSSTTPAGARLVARAAGGSTTTGSTPAYKQHGPRAGRADRERRRCRREARPLQEFGGRRSTARWAPGAPRRFPRSVSRLRRTSTAAWFATSGWRFGSVAPIVVRRSRDRTALRGGTLGAPTAARPRAAP